MRKGAPASSWSSKELVTLLEEHKHVVAYSNDHHHVGRSHAHKGIHSLNVKAMVETAKNSAYPIVKI